MARTRGGKHQINPPPASSPSSANFSSPSSANFSSPSYTSSSSVWKEVEERSLFQGRKLTVPSAQETALGISLENPSSNFPSPPSTPVTSAALDTQEREFGLCSSSSLSYSPPGPKSSLLSHSSTPGASDGSDTPTILDTCEDKREFHQTSSSSLSSDSFSLFRKRLSSTNLNVQAEQCSPKVQNDDGLKLRKAKVDIKRIPTDLLIKMEPLKDKFHKQTGNLGNDKSEYNQEFVKDKVSSQKKSSTNNNLAFVDCTPRTTSFKECPALNNHPNLQRLLSSSVVTCGAITSESTRRLGSSATGFQSNANATLPLGKSVKKYSGADQESVQSLDINEGIKSPKESEDVIILSVIKGDVETAQEISQTTRKEDSTSSRGVNKASFNQKVIKSKMEADGQTRPHFKGMRGVRNTDQFKLPNKDSGGRGISPIKGGSKIIPSVMKVQGRQNVEYKKHLSAAKRRGEGFTNGRSMEEGLSSGIGMGEELQPGWQWMTKGFPTGRKMEEGLHTGREMMQGLPAGRDLIEGSPGESGMLEGFAMSGMVDPPTRKMTLDPNKSKRLPAGCGLGIVEPGSTPHKRCMMAYGNEKQVPRKISGRGMSVMRLPRMTGGMRRLAPHLRGQAKMGMANGKRKTASNAIRKMMPTATDVSYGEGARSKTKSLKPKQEVIEIVDDEDFSLKQEVIDVVDLGDEDFSPDERSHIPPNNCSTLIPQMSLDASVPNPVLAKVLKNLGVSVSRCDRNPRQSKLPSGAKLPSGITLLPSSESSYSDQRTMLSSERNLKVQSGRENGNTSQRNMSSSERNLKVQSGRENGNTSTKNTNTSQRNMSSSERNLKVQSGRENGNTSQRNMSSSVRNLKVQFGRENGNTSQRNMSSSERNLKVQSGRENGNTSQKNISSERNLKVQLGRENGSTSQRNMSSESQLIVLKKLNLI